MKLTSHFFRYLAYSFCILLPAFAYPYNGNGKIVVVMDNGMFRESIGHFIPEDKIYKEGCFSKADSKVRYWDSRIRRSYDYYKFASTCPNGETKVIGKGASLVSRGIKNGFPSVEYNTLVYRYLNTQVSIDHGPQVASIVLQNAPGSKVYPINVTTYVDEREIGGCSSFQGICNTPRVEQIGYALNTILSTANNSFAAINLSLSVYHPSDLLCKNQIHNDVIQKLKAKGIAVITSAGNNSNRSRFFWPACLNDIITVGATGTSKGKFIVLEESNSAPGLDFLAHGVYPLYRQNKVTVKGTSYSSPVIAGAYAVLKQAKPTATVDQMTAALKRYGAGIYLPESKVTTYYINGQAIQNAARYLSKQPDVTDPTPPANPQTKKPNQTDTNKYGHNYGSNQNEKSVVIPYRIGQQPKLQANSTLNAKASTGTGKYRLTFQAFDIDTNGELSVYINGRLFQNLKANGNNRLTRYTFNNIGANFLRAGTNNIEFRQKRTNETWGVTNITLSEMQSPTITLALGRTNTTTYGYGIGTNQHITQLTARFTKPNYDVQFSLQGWDIDVGDESGVYLNGKLLGYQHTGPSSNFNSSTRFIIRKNQMVAGTNTIQLRQKTPGGNFNGFEDEKWGVRNMLIKQYVEPKASAASIAPIIMLLLDDED